MGAVNYGYGSGSYSTTTNATVNMYVTAWPDHPVEPARPRTALDRRDARVEQTCAKGRKAIG
jgi:hypothetical protein